MDVFIFLVVVIGLPILIVGPCVYLASKTTTNDSDDTATVLKKIKRYDTMMGIIKK